MDTISMRYARSLFELAKEENKVLVYQGDMKLVEQVFTRDITFIKFFNHVSIKDDVKIKLLDNSFKDKLSIYVLNFLKLLIDKRRIKYILSICREFQSLCNDYLGIKEGKLYSAYPLDKDQIFKIEESISNKINSKVKLTLVIDESLIGGIKVIIDNHIYDDSLLYKLEALKEELLRK